MLTYQTPPKAIADIIDAPRMPAVIFSPDGKCLALLPQPGLPSIEEVSAPELRLAGLRIDSRNHGPSRALRARGLALLDIATGRERTVAGLPDPVRIGSASFSPDGAHIAFTQNHDDAIELWLVEVANARACRVTDVRICDIYGAAHPCFAWLSDSKHLICRTRRQGLGEPPAAPPVPAGPVVEESAGVRAAARTYQDLLQNPHDERLFEHFAAADLVKVSLRGDVERVSESGLIRAFDPSPDGCYVLVDRLERPFSYLVPHVRFPTRVELWTTQGERIREVVALPLAEDIPIGMDAVRRGPRAFTWRPDRDCELHWVEALDGGDPRANAQPRERMFRLVRPDASAPTPVLDLQLRHGGTLWSEHGFALVRERWWNQRRERISLVKPDGVDKKPRILWDRSFEDRYSDPGRPLTLTNARGRNVLATDGNGTSIFLGGEGASPEGDRPFLDRLHTVSGESQRLWQSTPPRFEHLVKLLDVDTQSFVTTMEAPDEPPNLVLHTVATDDGRALTAFAHPYPHMKGVYKEIMKYGRDDGTALTATLYLPPGRKPEDGPFPTLLWAYPREFKDADAAGQMRGSPWRFNQILPGGPLPLLAVGYAILDGPAMPIVGEGEAEPNDTYVEQLVASAEAAVRAVVDRGIADPERIAVAGHSYGGFMTANLLAHTDLFATGIARSGAYNRTLTPFGFQMEERTYWEAPAVYQRMSPFDHADKIRGPILLIHGDADNNPGTFPLQSERFYAALKGLGAVARFVRLPNESHGYQARESVMHTQWEMYQWLERYLRQREPTAPS